MNKYLYVTLVAIIFLLVIGQITISDQEAEKKEPSTKLEAFLAKKGRLIVKDFYSLGMIMGQYGTSMKIQAITINEPGQESNIVKGLVIEIEEGRQYEKSNRSFLDMEEIESLSQALQYMMDLAKKWETSNKEYTEVIFSTKGDFQVGFYQKVKTQSAFSSSGYIGKVNCILHSVAKFDDVKNIVDKGLQLLKEK